MKYQLQFYSEDNILMHSTVREEEEVGGHVHTWLASNTDARVEIENTNKDN